MKKNLLPTIFDTVFVFLASFIVVFAVIRFYSELWLALLFGLIIAFMITVLFRMLANRKSARYALKKEDAKKMENVLNTLCLMTTDELNTFFISLFDKMKLPYAFDGDAITLTDTNTVVRYYFTFSKAYEGRIIEFYKKTDAGQKLLVVGREFSEETIGLTPRFAGRIRLLDGTNLYLTMKRFEIFPTLKTELKTEKQAVNLPKALFSKRRAKQFFLYGLTLQFFSFFVYYPVYYICFGSALMIFSVLCFFFGIKDEPEMKNPFRE